MGAGSNIAKGALNTLTGNIETAQLIIHDYRDIAASSGAGSKAMPTKTMLAALNNERIAATKAALDAGTAPSYPNSKDKVFKVHETRVVEGSGEPGQILELNKTGLVIACGEGAVEIRSLQAEGGKRMAAPDYFRGHPLQL